MVKGSVGSKTKVKDFDLNECPDVEVKKPVTVKASDREILITRRVLRSGSVGNSDKCREDVEKKRRGDVCSVVELKGGVGDEDVPEETHGDGSKSVVDEQFGKESKAKGKRGRPPKLQRCSQSDDKKGKREVKLEDVQSGDENGDVERKEDVEKVRKGGVCSVLELKKVVEDQDVPEETHGDGCKSLVDEKGSFEQSEKVKDKRGRPPKLERCSQSDDKEEKRIIGGSSFGKGKRDKDGQSGDENGDVEPHGEEMEVKRKRGRPKKGQISSGVDESVPNTNGKLVGAPDLSSQSSLDRDSSKPRRGRPPKGKETAVVLDMKKESDSIDESSGPKSNNVGRVKGSESDGGSGRGRKMLRKRGRPPTPQKKIKSGVAGESSGNADKRLKLPESPLESRPNNTLTDEERRNGEEENKQTEAEKLSRSQSKKMLSDRIVQLLLAAGWRVEYRPRNGRDYQDAVYVNPEGKTHWSVTKAYGVYKEKLKSSMNDSSTTGSGFGLLPEEDLHLLARNTQKKRCDKGKRKRNWKDEESNENMVSKKGNRKQEKNRMQKKQKGGHGSQNVEQTSVTVRKTKREGKHKRKRCGLSARSSLENADSKENGYTLFEGKRTMMGWMIDSAIVPLNGKVQCMNCEKTQVLQEGIITKEGIQCNCCDKVFSALSFEVHAGSKHSSPFKSLYLEGGNSLLQCFLESWNKQSESQPQGFHSVDFGVGEQNDDTCAICGDGGDLICCDGCPSTFHQSCLGIKRFPSGAWFCCFCSCKFCEKVEAVSNDTTTSTPFSRCRLCEEKYHKECMKQDNMLPGETIPDSFCGKYCQELFEGIELLIGVQHALPEGYSWTFLRRSELPHEVANCDMSEKIAYNAKLAVAFSVMDECFSPLVDHRSGVNLLENIVYNFGSNFHRLNYGNFLTAVLERGDEIIGVASIRIHGNQLAEMPFIGTRYMYRRQGMCRRLMNGIESALESLKVEKLVIPAVPELMDTWTSGFGFKPVHESAKKAIKNLNLLVFPGVDMLEKPLGKEKIAKLIPTPGYLLVAPEMKLHVDVDEDKPEESEDGAHERNGATADVESPFDSVDSCLKLRNVEEGDDDTESKEVNKNLEEKEEIPKLTDEDGDSLLVLVDNQRESNPGSGDLENKTLLSDDGGAVKAEGTKESDEQPDCYIIGHSGNGGTEKEIDKKGLARKKKVTSGIRASRRLIQKSWGTSSVIA